MMTPVTRSATALTNLTNAGLFGGGHPAHTVHSPAPADIEKYWDWEDSAHNAIYLYYFMCLSVIIINDPK